MSSQVSRRRFITISAAAGAFAFAGSVAAEPVRWRGTALGARASLLLWHPDRDEAARIISACVSEMKRLEKIFSLYRDGSALRRLNDKGDLRNPPPELVQALSDSRRISEITAGAFDISVQPLWQLYANHFSQPGADPAGPPAADLDAARKLVDYRRIHIDTDRISLDRPGMAITLNGFAQGFITDRIAQLLRFEGQQNVLVDMGETRALDRHPDGRLWRVGVRDPQDRQAVVRTLAVENKAVATSGSYGHKFDAAGKANHLFDPRTGGSSQRYASVTVVASLAATADALSTGLSSLRVAEMASCLELARAQTAHVLHQDGSFVDIRV